MQNYPDPTAVGAEGSGPFYSPSNAPSQRISSPGELRLAAQLSRGLEPMMAAENDREMNDASNEPPQGDGGHQFAQEHQLLTQLEHAAMDQGQYTMGDSATARKRSKVSRACDECRRKKIRCDSTTESGEEPCSSCKRVGTRCLFSRVPMKRGPSKGYIKELADRLNHLEGAMQVGVGEPPQYAVNQHDHNGSRRASRDYSPPHPEGHQRKRTFSTMSQDFSSPGYQPQRPSANWAPSETPRHPHQNSTTTPSSHSVQDSSHGGFRSQYTPNGLAPQAHWKNTPDVAQRPSVSFDITPGQSGFTDTHTEWSDETAETYYNLIHPTFPILSQSKANIGARLEVCPGILKDAFLEALQAATRSFNLPNASIHQERQNTRKAMNLLASSQFENPASRNLSTNLTHLQTLILMAIEAGNYGLPGLRSSSGPLQSVWLGSAVGLAYTLKLHVPKASDAISDGNADSDEKLARRVWWSLIMMDRFHASATSSPLMIPETSVVLLPEDERLLGDATYQLLRLTLTLGHLATVFVSPPTTTLKSGSIFSLILSGELELFRTALPASVTPTNASAVHLAYWHLRLLTKRPSTSPEPSDLLECCSQVVNHLTDTAISPTPMSYQFAVLAALTLADLAEYDETRDGADRIIKLLIEAPIRTIPSAWDSAIRGYILTRRNPSVSGGSAAAASQHALTASQGLQHLADLATATEPGRTETPSDSKPDIGTVSAFSWDPTDLYKYGFLALLGGDVGRP